MAREIFHSEGRVRKIITDPICREAGGALVRTALNTGISIADFAPATLGAGEMLSWGADAAKLIRWVNRIPYLRRLTRRIDLTPDISKKSAIVSEAGELIAFIPPTHAFESILQLVHHDIPRIKRGGRRAREIWGQRIID